MSGLIRSTVAGREDRLPMALPIDSYVIPADVVSALGQGNTESGASILDQLFSAHAQNAPAMASGGRSTDIVAAGGEYLVPPAAVRGIGRGDARKGHDYLDKMVTQVRAKHIKRLSKLPGPKK